MHPLPWRASQVARGARHQLKTPTTTPPQNPKNDQDLSPQSPKSNCRDSHHHHGTSRNFRIAGWATRTLYKVRTDWRVADRKCVDPRLITTSQPPRNIINCNRLETSPRGRRVPQALIFHQSATGFDVHEVSGRLTRDRGYRRCGAVEGMAPTKRHGGTYKKVVGWRCELKISIDDRTAIHTNLQAFQDAFSKILHRGRRLPGLHCRRPRLRRYTPHRWGPVYCMHARSSLPTYRY